jgi:hypothetical protein
MGDTTFTSRVFNPNAAQLELIARRQPDTPKPTPYNNNGTYPLEHNPFNANSRLRIAKFQIKELQKQIKDEVDHLTINKQIEAQILKILNDIPNTEKEYKLSVLNELRYADGIINAKLNVMSIPLHNKRWFWGGRRTSAKSAKKRKRTVRKNRYTKRYTKLA